MVEKKSGYLGGVDAPLVSIDRSVFVKSPIEKQLLKRMKKNFKNG